MVTISHTSINDLTGYVIGAGIRVHRALGPGLLESIYENCLSFELGRKGLFVERQTMLPVTYEGITMEGGYRIDLLIEQSVIVEIKSVEVILPVHHAQLLTYLKLSGKPVGLLLNFNVPKLSDGIKRMINTPGSLDAPGAP